MKRLLAFGLAFVLCGCPLFKKKSTDDSTTDDSTSSSSGSTSTGTTGAKNEKDITRYADKETKCEGEMLVSQDVVHPRTYATGGTEIATLTKFAHVTCIAKYFASAVLVTFDDPKGGGKMLGWVLPEQISDGSTPLAGSASAGPQAVAFNGGIGKPVDAGIKTDAGVRDAGAAPTTNTSPLFLPLPANGKCPAPFQPLDSGCRRPCTTDASCPVATFCASRNGKKYCSTSK